MTVRAVEWKKPYTWWKAIEITEDKVINLRLRDENNLIIYDEWDNEIYVDLQLPDEITPTDAFPVWVTTGRVIVDNGWDWQGTIVCFKTTSWDNIKLLYADDWKLYIDNWTGTFKQIYLKWEVDALLQALRDYVDQQLALKQDKLIAWNNISIAADGKTISATMPTTSRFLSLWDCSTWQPISFPASTPFEYITWDHFLVETVDTTTNYRPSWTEYTGVASTTVETEDVQVWDLYIYDGTAWLLQLNHDKEVSFANIAWQPTDNTNLATALNAKQDALATQTAYTSKGSATKVPQITTNSLWQVTGITEVTITQPDISWKQDKATSWSTAPSSTPSYVWQQYVDTTNDKLYFATGTSSSSDWEECWSGSGTWDVLWPNSSTDWDVVLFDWVTWKLIKDSWKVLPTKTSDLSNDSGYITSASLPWTATSSTAWTVKLASDTTQSESAQTVSSTVWRTYWVQLNSSNQMVVNVPWTDTQAVTSVNTQTWAVVLDADDISDTSTTNKFVTSTEKSTWSWKQDALTAGSNISITASQWTTTISATDTTYSAGTWIDISNQNAISVDGDVVLEYSNLINPVTLNSSSIYAWVYGDPSTQQISTVDIEWKRIWIAIEEASRDTHRVQMEYYNGADLYISDTVSWVRKSAEYTSSWITATTTWESDEVYEFKWGWNNQIARLKNIPSYSAGTNVQISAQNVISATDTTYSAGTGISINGNNAISNTLPWPVVSASAPSSPSEWDLWYDTTNDVLKSYNGTSWEEWGTKMTVLKYGTSTWQDFLNAYNNNAIVYCMVASWTSWYRMAFMAYIAGTATPTSVEFQYYRSRSDHNTQANQLDEVYVYKLENNWTWTTTTRDTWAKIVAWNNVSITRGSWNAVINASWWIQNDTAGTTSTLSNVWVWSEAEYALINPSSTTLYFCF